MEQEHPQIVAVGGVVYRCTSHGEVELLLIKKYGGFWTLPKGRIKRDEHPIAAVQREVYEETGLAGAVEAPIREVMYKIVKRGQPCHKVVTYYLFRAEAGRLRPDKRERIARLRWFPIPHALDHIHRDRVREVAQHASTLLQDARAES
ncbi:MAG TPA: NUDIX domain-containing protein [Roseiflexaceae bacterium]|nr:NUDIX domain-containing protein [Roseiflexaceae bacterium]